MARSRQQIRFTAPDWAVVHRTIHTLWKPGAVCQISWQAQLVKAPLWKVGSGGTQAASKPDVTGGSGSAQPMGSTI